MDFQYYIFNKEFLHENFNEEFSFKPHFQWVFSEQLNDFFKFKTQEIRQKSVYYILSLSRY